MKKKIILSAQIAEGWKWNNGSYRQTSSKSCCNVHYFSFHIGVDVMKCEHCGVSYSSGTMHSCKPTFRTLTDEERKDYRAAYEKLVRPAKCERCQDLKQLLSDAEEVNIHQSKSLHSAQEVIEMWKNTAESYHEQWEVLRNRIEELEEENRNVKQSLQEIWDDRRMVEKELDAIKRENSQLRGRITELDWTP